MNDSPQPATPPSSSVPRRLIREAAIQLLHSSIAQGEKREEAGDPWPLILAQPRAKITRLRARAILHQQQNRPSRSKVVLTTRANTLTLIQTFIDERKAQKFYRSLCSVEESFPESFDLLRRQLKSEKEPETIEATVERIQEQNTTALESLEALIEIFGPVDASPEPLRPLVKSLTPLRETAKTLKQLFSSTPPDLRELESLHEAIAEHDSLKSEAEQLHNLTLEHLTSTDKLIADKLENFSPERLGQVDRNVLRVAATELHHCPEIPSAVSINEAIEIVRRFGDTESSSFVNGILDKLAPEKE